MSSVYKYSAEAFKSLSGYLCVYKPKGVAREQFAVSVADRIVALLNRMPHSPPRHVVTISPRSDYERQLIEGSERRDVKNPLFRPRKSSDGDSNDKLVLPRKTIVSDEFVVEVKKDLSESALVLGDRYIRRDLQLVNIDDLCEFSSGVSLFAIGERSSVNAERLMRMGLLRTYLIRGQLGRATHDFTCDSHTMMRASWRHVTHAKMDRILASMQRQSERTLHALIGINPHSQKAYEMLASGRPLRMPHVNRTDSDSAYYQQADRVGTAHGHLVFNRLRCVEFSPPDFALETVVAGESCTSIFSFVDQLGSRLGSMANCTQLRRSHFGACSADHCLLPEEISSIDRVVDNIDCVTNLIENQLVQSRLPVFT